jgi:hypothetical protein
MYFIRLSEHICFEAHGHGVASRNVSQWAEVEIIFANYRFLFQVLRFNMIKYNVL